MEKDSVKYIWIDALRGLAILGVVLVHTAQLHYFDIFGQRAVRLAETGRYGVQLFFLVSSLTLLLSLRSRSSREAAPLRNFFIRRFFRIAPLFWFGIALYTAIFGFSREYWAPDGIGLPHILATLTFLHGWHPATINSVVPGGWSIAVEMVFYLMVPFLAARLTTLPRTVWTILGSLIVATALQALGNRLVVSHFPPDRQYLPREFFAYWLPSQLPIFLLGFLLYHITFNTAAQSLSQADRKSLAGSLMCFFAYLAVTMGLGSSSVLTNFLYGITFLLLAFALSLNPSELIVNRATRLLGNLSFSIYISHFAVIELVKYLVPKETVLANLKVAPVGFVVVLAASMAFAQVLHWCIEKPGILMGKKLIAALDAVKQPAAAPAVAEEG